MANETFSFDDAFPAPKSQGATFSFEEAFNQPPKKRNLAAVVNDTVIEGVNAAVGGVSAATLLSLWVVLKT